MLNTNPNERISAEDAINHSWVQLKGVKETNIADAREALSNLQTFNVSKCFDYGRRIKKCSKQY